MYWGSDKLETLKAQAELMVCFLFLVESVKQTERVLYPQQYKERYLKMYGNNPTSGPPQRTGKSAMRKLGVLLRELSDDDDEPSTSVMSTLSGDSNEPWLPSFNSYLQSSDHLGDMSIVEWWSVCIATHLFPQS